MSGYYNQIERALGGNAGRGVLGIELLEEKSQRDRNRQWQDGWDGSGVLGLIFNESTCELDEICSLHWLNFDGWFADGCR